MSSVWTGSISTGTCRICRSPGRWCSFSRCGGSRSRGRRWTRSGNGFRDAVGGFAAANHIAVVRFAKGDRKIDVMRKYIDRQAATGRSGVAAIGVVQEFQWVFSCTTTPARGGGAPHFGWVKAQRRSRRTTSMSGTTISGPGSSRSAATSRTRSRSGSTATRGPSSRRSGPGSGSRRRPTGSPPAMAQPGCRRSVTGSGRAPSGCSSNAGWGGCRCR